MEPVEGSMKQKLRINYTVLTSVVKAEVIGSKWYIHFDGSRESIAFDSSSEPSPFEAGDQVKITFEKVQA